MVTAVVMAGGRGARMKFNGEKPMIPIQGKPMIQHVLEAVQSSREVDDVVVATSKNTPLTTDFVRKSGLKAVETPGKGYVNDLGFIIRWLGDSKGYKANKSEHNLKHKNNSNKSHNNRDMVGSKGSISDNGQNMPENSLKTRNSDDILVTITADLPLITGKILDDVIREYRNCGKPAMCVAVPLEFFTKYNLKPHMIMGDKVPSGLNILRRNNNEQDEEVLELRKFELALNINSPEDLISLEKYFDFKSFKQVINKG